MTRKDHLSNEVSIEGKITETGLSATAKSRALASFDRLLGAVLDVPAAKLEVHASLIRRQGRLDTSIFSDSEEFERINASLANEQLASYVQSQANAKHVAEKAAVYLRSPSPESEMESDKSEVDPDWLNHFRAHAEKATSEEVRDLWARVLAGEIRKPESFSPMTLRFLAELDKKIATWFEEETSLRIQGKCILRHNNYDGERMERMLFLEEVGLLSHISPNDGMILPVNPDSEGNAAFEDGNFCLMINSRNRIEIPIINITRIGREICSIFPPVNSMCLLKEISKNIYEKVNTMHLCRIVEKIGDTIHAKTIEILKS